MRGSGGKGSEEVVERGVYIMGLHMDVLRMDVLHGWRTVHQWTSQYPHMLRVILDRAHNQYKIYGIKKGQLGTLNQVKTLCGPVQLTQCMNILTGNG